MSDDKDKPKIAVLEDEPQREQVNLDPPEPVTKEMQRGAKVTGMIAFLFVLVFGCGGSMVGVYLFMNQPEVGGSLLVLPVVIQDEGPAADKIADDLTKEMIASLSAQEGLQVRPYTDSAKLKGDERGLGEIGKAEGVRFVVEANVEPKDEGKSVKLVVKLIHAEKGGQIFNEPFTGNMADISTIEDDVAEKIFVGTGVKKDESK